MATTTNTTPAHLRGWTVVDDEDLRTLKEKSERLDRLEAHLLKSQIGARFVREAYEE